MKYLEGLRYKLQQDMRCKKTWVAKIHGLQKTWVANRHGLQKDMGCKKTWVAKRQGLQTDMGSKKVSSENQSF